MTHAVRRVVTGLDAEGRSTVLFDGSRSGDGPQVLWHSPVNPADNAGGDDAGAIDFSGEMFRSPGSMFMLFELPPAAPGEPPLVHATNTIDYIVVLKGRIELQLEDGSVELDPGDCVIQRGTIHAWRALDGKPAVSVGVLLPAHPVGAGATI